MRAPAASIWSTKRRSRGGSKQHETLLDDIGQGRADGRMRFADSAAEMRRYMQDLHSAATAVNLRLVPPGGSTFGSNRHGLLEFIQQRDAVGVDIVGQAMAELAAIAADAILLAAAFQMLQPQSVHRLGGPDLLHRLDAHVADDELAAPIEEAGARPGRRHSPNSRRRYTGRCRCRRCPAGRCLC